MSNNKQPSREELIKILGTPFNELSSVERGHKLDMLFNQVSGLQNTLQQMRKQYFDMNAIKTAEIAVLKKMLSETNPVMMSQFNDLLEIEIDATRGLVKASPEAIIENKDWVRVNYVGFDDKGEIAKGTQGQSEIYLGAKQFIEDFENAIIGMKCGESKENVPCNFPADYPVKDFAGQVIKFNIQVLAHKKPIMKAVPNG
jgi:hypothetical protein